MSVTYYNIYIYILYIYAYFPYSEFKYWHFFVYSTFSDAPDTARFRSKTWHLWDAKEIMQRWIPEWMNSASVWWQFLVAPTLITLLGSMGQATLSPKTTGWYSDFLVSSHDNTDDHLAWKTFYLGVMMAGQLWAWWCGLWVPTSPRSVWTNFWNSTRLSIQKWRTLDVSSRQGFHFLIRKLIK